MLNNFDDFVEVYVADSIKNGYMSPKEICNKVLFEIEEIDKKIRETNELRLRYRNLKQVLRSFDHESVRKTKTNTYLTNELNISNICNEFIENIYNFMKNSGIPVSAREIIDNVGNRDKHQEIYISIKYMCDKGILSRGENRLFIPGPNFNDYPNIKTNI